eukprot:CAMPEP_0204430508 /NCGR_PEP_ID=MMETSP0470-20130426/62680_1 /ASSEMBLY_ACC=CAM_ASM_000385 /TAXON_ID=2969 /ORGANISM="Oxyrrhis marina" /LENGTH=77 /DNA_ID=CAMNT_0051428627 /DNA_START=90 /DNA_END=323 /DNA_ORIENTATION=+
MQPRGSSITLSRQVAQQLPPGMSSVTQASSAVVTAVRLLQYTQRPQSKSSGGGPHASEGSHSAMAGKQVAGEGSVWS